MSHKLKPKQKLAAQFFARGESGVMIAMRLKIRRETITRWRKLPAFQHEIDSYAEEIHQYATHRMETLIDHAFIAINLELRAGSGSKRAETALKLLQMVENGTLRFPTKRNTSVCTPVHEALPCMPGVEPSGVAPAWSAL